MKRLLLSLIIFAAHSLADTVLEGRVDLPKTAAGPVVAKRYEIVTKGGVLAPYPPFGVVWLEGNFPPPAVLAVQQMAQKNLAFVTPLLVIRKGTRVEFPNLDDTHHNIFSFSAAKRFDLGRYTRDLRPIPSQVFDKPGLVTLRCDIHEHMRALILVLDTPYFAKTDLDGRYRLAGVPAGRYTLKAWVSSTTTFEHPVELKAGSGVHLDLP